MENINHSHFLAISFGGSKISVAILDSTGIELICKSPRIEWKVDPRWDKGRPLESLIDLITDIVVGLSENPKVDVALIEKVGIAWPGPGNYSKGLLSATFIPECRESVPIHSLLVMSLRNRLQRLPETLTIVSRLDVNVRAYGEIFLPEGGFCNNTNEGYNNGIVLNIATGIAGAIVKNRSVLKELKGLGENYGQWGRFLFMNKSNGRWRWRPETEGGIGPHDEATEVRLTDLLGGPAIYRNFVIRLKNSKEFLSCFECMISSDILERLLTNDTERDIELERKCLGLITEAYLSGVDHMCAFVTELAMQTGGALACLREVLGEEMFGKKIVFTGGIGELFATPQFPDRPDLFMEEVSGVLNDKELCLMRSKVGLDAELIGCACI